MNKPTFKAYDFSTEVIPIFHGKPVYKTAFKNAIHRLPAFVYLIRPLSSLGVSWHPEAGSIRPITSLYVLIKLF